MNKFKASIIGLAYFLFFFNNTTVAVENKILFKIDNEIITSLDILSELKYLDIINDKFKEIDRNQKIEIAKRSLIREKIKEIELKKIVKEIKIEEDLLNNLLINNFEKKINSISDFENYFNKIDINPDLIRKKISIEVLWNQLIYSKYNMSVKIDKKAIENSLLNKNKQKEFLLSEILFTIENTEELNKKFDLIKQSIKKTNFSEASIVFSTSDTANIGGKLGWIKEAAINLKIRKILESIKIGEHTIPIVVPGGFLILKKEDVREVKSDINFEKEFEIILKEKTNEQLNQFSNIYFNKVKKNIFINEF